MFCGCTMIASVGRVLQFAVQGREKRPTTKGWRKALEDSRLVLCSHSTK